MSVWCAICITKFLFTNGKNHELNKSIITKQQILKRRETKNQSVAVQPSTSPPCKSVILS